MNHPIEAIITMSKNALTEKETTVLYYTAVGYTAAEIADVVDQSTRTVEAIKAKICIKLQAENMAHAVFLACRRGILK